MTTSSGLGSDGASTVQRRDAAIRPRAWRRGLRPLSFHALRHAAGSLVAREAGARFVQAFLGHSRLSTTERYLHPKARPEDVAILNRPFASASEPAVSRIRDGT
jgi:integrase